MKKCALIALTAALLLLLPFGGGGLMLSKCACSGKTRVVLPMDDGCCSRTGGCMTYTVVKTSVAEMQAPQTLPQVCRPLMFAIVPLVLPTVVVGDRHDAMGFKPYGDDGPPGRREALSVVLRC